MRVTNQGLDGTPGNIAAASKKTLDCKSGTLIFRVISASGPQMQWVASHSKTTPMSTKLYMWPYWQMVYVYRKEEPKGRRMPQITQEV